MEHIFTDGIFFDLPREGAPEFVKGRMSFKVAEAIAWLQKHQNNAGFVNIDLKVGQSGKAYAELNTWQPEKPEGLRASGDRLIDYPKNEDINPDDVPF